jgi:hypothetical protein
MVYIPINVIGLLLLAAFDKTRGIAFGALTAMGVNAFISFAMGVVMNAYCLIPFPVEGY